MAFQQTVSLAQGYGVAGSIVYDGPIRSAPWTMVSTPEPNVIGATAYTVVSEGIAIAGGVGAFAGILGSPKSYTAAIVNSGPTMTLPDETIGELYTMAQMLVTLTTAANIGDLVVYDTATGALSSVAPSFAATASFATNVMTVTASSGVIGVGSAVNFAGVPPGTVVASLGTGTGGAGTYNLSTTPGTVASVAGKIAAGTFAGTGKAFVPNASVILRASAANGPAIIELNN